MPLFKTKQTAAAIIIASLISAAVGYYLFEFNWPFLPLPLLSGIVIAFTVRGDRVVRHLPALITGSLFYGFLAITMIYSRNYLIGLIYGSGFPFWPLYNPREYLIAMTVFAFIGFLGGLIGIVLKGLIQYLGHKS